MGIHVRWEDEPLPPETEWKPLGELRDDQSLVERFLVHSKIQDLPTLLFMSGSTMHVFHQRHMRPLIDDLETLSKRQHEPEVERHLRAVLEFVRQAYSRAKGSIIFEAD